MFLFCQKDIFEAFQQIASSIKINQVNNYRAIQRKTKINRRKFVKILEKTRSISNKVPYKDAKKLKEKWDKGENKLKDISYRFLWVLLPENIHRNLWCVGCDLRVFEKERKQKTQCDSTSCFIELLKIWKQASQCNPKSSVWIVGYWDG